MATNFGMGGRARINFQGCPRGLVRDTPPDIELLQTTILVGGTAKQSMNEIWDMLIDDISMIGVWGMGGVGKTTLAMHIYNQVLQTKHTKHVYWVNVSQESTVYKLQDSIAKKVNLDLSNVMEEKLRAAKLCKALREEHDFVLILDDVWKPFSLRDVGIPSASKIGKLIVTTRIYGVCYQMGCQSIIKIEPLWPNEAWNLFLENLGHGVELPEEIEEIAESIVEKCTGLPLAIETVAKSMKGVDDIQMWRDALEEIKECDKHDEEDLVFTKLKLSYNHLRNDLLKHCVLFSALYPEDCCIPRVQLIKDLLHQGFIKRSSMQAKLDKGHNMVTSLESACMLESVRNDEGIECVKMHGLIRDMSLRIAKVCPRFMVKAGIGLQELPDLQFWEEDLEVVSLMRNSIEEVTPYTSPKCPKLSTLLLQENESLKIIPKSFFVNMQGLKVLDISKTAIKNLPESVSNLANLTTLLLRSCKELTYIPSVEKLTKLIKLDLYEAGIREVPKGMDKLNQLQILNLCDTNIEDLPCGLLPKLFSLQCLMIAAQVEGRMVVKAEEVLSLSKLGSLQCVFENGQEYNNYVNSVISTQRGLNSYYLGVGRSRQQIIDLDEFRLIEFRTVVLNGEFFSMIGENCATVTNDIKDLTITGFSEITDICDVWSSREDWWVPFENLESLQVSRLESVLELIGPTRGPARFGTFALLKRVIILECPKIQKLFPSRLPNLQKLIVDGCENLEIIFAEVQESKDIVKLQNLGLCNLPKLKSICEGLIHCDSIQEITVMHCPRLKRFPLHMPVKDNDPPLYLPKLKANKEWWESLEWDDPSIEFLLRPFVVFI
ncbi:Leucine-rich repeat [Dillenia turbinata]|uniref:Leucine-rich repeat n=1 Tax=Dillenia turbinata TaxID=194707 RepID=A0AAN8VC37_9MAGN